jgi:hypothetical protein
MNTHEASEHAAILQLFSSQTMGFKRKTKCAVSVLVAVIRLHVTVTLHSYQHIEDASQWLHLGNIPIYRLHADADITNKRVNNK